MEGEEIDDVRVTSQSYCARRSCRRMSLRALSYFFFPPFALTARARFTCLGTFTLRFSRASSFTLVLFSLRALRMSSFEGCHDGEEGEVR